MPPEQYCGPEGSGLLTEKQAMELLKILASAVRIFERNLLLRSPFFEDWREALNSPASETLEMYTSTNPTWNTPFIIMGYAAIA